MLGYKISVNRFKNFKIIASIFSDDNGMKLKINSRKTTGKFTDLWKLNTLLTTNDSKRKSKGKLENILR